MNRRLFLQRCSAAGALATTSIYQEKLACGLASGVKAQGVHGDAVPLPDDGWSLYWKTSASAMKTIFVAISGRESTSIENLSGIVDNLRNFKGDPELIASSLRPVRPVAKQYKLCCAMGERAVFDLYLLNDTGRAAGASDPEVVMAYSRERDRKIGAASFVCKIGSTPRLVHRAPEFRAPLQQRWLANTIAYLTRPEP